MSKDHDIDYKLAKKELKDAVLELCKITGQPLPDIADGEPPFCSFCGKGKNQVRKMVAGPSVHICSECVAEGQRIIDEE